MTMDDSRLTSGEFSSRDSLAQRLISAIHSNVLTEDRYLIIDTGIESRFEHSTEVVHQLLYNSLGPTTDLLRYFPDYLYFDRKVLMPDWKAKQQPPELLSEACESDEKGMFSFYVEYKFSATERRTSINDVPTEFIGQIEREAWLTYRRLTSPNPDLNIYLDGERPRIAMFYAASYAPERIYACWEHDLDQIAIRSDIARPGGRSISTAGSGTPWVNFDIRTLKDLARFLTEDLHWDSTEANEASEKCKDDLY